MEVGKIYDAASYSCTYQDTKTQTTLMIRSVELHSNDFLVLTAVDRLRIKDASLKSVEVAFLGVRIVPVLVSSEVESNIINCTLMFASVIHVLLFNPPHLLTSSARACVNADAVATGAAADGILSVISLIEEEEKERRLSEQELQSLQKKAEQQRRNVIKHRNEAISTRERMLPGIQKNLEIVYKQLLAASPKEIQSHAQHILETLELMIVPMKPREVRSKYGDWIDDNHVGVLTLPDGPLQQKIRLTTEEDIKIKELNVYRFSLLSWKQPTGGKELFITQLPNALLPSVGMIRKDTDTNEYGRLIRTEGIVQEWLPVITGETRLHPSILEAGDVSIEYHVPVQSSAVITGTAYVIASELLKT